MVASQSSKNIRDSLAKQPKTSSCRNQKQVETNTANFWKNLTKMAEKARKVETLNLLIPTGPETSLNTRIRTPQKHYTNVLGKCERMNSVKKRNVSGSEFPERNQEGRSMNAILQPDSVAQTRRAMTPQASNFIRSSNDIGSSSQIYNSKEALDPANLLKPAANFRRASEASINNNILTNDKLQKTQHKSRETLSRTRSF